MDWPRLGAVLHTTGLWGRSYLGVGRRAASRTWQKLCHREDTGLPWGKPYRGRIHIWDYPKGNQAIRTPSPVQGLTGDPGKLTPVLGLASDCSAQSDCRGCLEDSTRVHHPGNWTGEEKGDEIMLSQGPAVHCIVVSRNSGYIHFQGGGWQPTLQPFVQERKHYSNRASSGVFSARRTPSREQTPFQCIGLPCWRSPSLNDGLYHRRW